MLLTERTAESVAPGCPSCGVPVTPRVGTDVQAVEPVLATLLGPQQRAYLARVFTPAEIADSGLDAGADLRVVAESLAARFAAKEAALKVLRPEVGTPRPPWRDIEVVREPSGAPRVELHAAAARSAATAGLTSFTCSLSHDAGVAVAVVAALEISPDPTVQSSRSTVREVHHGNR